MKTGQNIFSKSCFVIFVDFSDLLVIPIIYNLKYMVRIPKWTNLKEFFLNLFPFWTPQIVPKTGQNHPKMSQKGTLSLDLTNPLGIWITPSSTRRRVFKPVWQPRLKFWRGFLGGDGGSSSYYIYMVAGKSRPPVLGGIFRFAKSVFLIFLHLKLILLLDRWRGIFRKTGTGKSPPPLGIRR